MNDFLRLAEAPLRDNRFSPGWFVVIPNGLRNAAKNQA